MATISHNITIPDDNPPRAARILARHFFVLLKRNGFNDDQVIAVASGLLECLNENLEAFEQRRGGEQIPE